MLKPGDIIVACVFMGFAVTSCKAPEKPQRRPTGGVEANPPPTEECDPSVMDCPPTEPIDVPEVPAPISTGVPAEVGVNTPEPSTPPAEEATECKGGSVKVALTAEKIALCAEWGGGNACETDCWSAEMKKSVEDRLNSPTSPSASGKTCACRTTACNLRSGPTTSEANIIRTATKNESFVLLQTGPVSGSGCTASWAKIRVDGATGYLCRGIAICND